MDYLDEDLPRPQRIGPRRLKEQKPERPRSGYIAKRVVSTKPIEKWRGHHLYLYLKDKAPSDVVWQLARDPLVGSFNTWLRSGLSPALVRAMLDAFLTQTQWHHTPGRLAYLNLIYKREDLRQMVSKLQQREEAKARRTDKDYWLGNPRAD